MLHCSAAMASPGAFAHRRPPWAWGADGFGGAVAARQIPVAPARCRIARGLAGPFGRAFAPAAGASFIFGNVAKLVQFAGLRPSEPPVTPEYP